MHRIRVASPAAVEQMAAANHAPLTRRSHFAATRVGGELYWWAA